MKLCNVLSEYSRKGYHLGDVVLKVNELMYGESEGIPEACHTLTYEVYLKYAGAGCQQDSTEICAQGKL